MRAVIATLLWSSSLRAASLRATPRAEAKLVFARDELLITAEKLYAELDDTVVIDVISTEAFAADPACVPGSRRCWRDDCERTENGVSSMRPRRRDFQALVRSLGVHSSVSKVVIVDRGYDATRLWWLFLVFGMRVRVLDGGLAAWRDGGFPCASSHAPRCDPAASTFEARPEDGRLIATIQDVLELRDAPTRNLWDVRSPEEFDGEVCLKGAARPGRIPWCSGRVEHGLFRHPDFGPWRSGAELRAAAAAFVDAPHTFYCQSGVRTTQLIFGLALDGRAVETLRNFDSSWVEWSMRRPRD